MEAAILSADSTAAARRKRIRSSLQAAARPEVLASMQRLVPGARMLGVKVPEIRALAAQCAKDDPLTFPETLLLFDALCAEKLREEILVGIFLLARHKKHLRELPWSAIDRWLNYIDNWETCDQLAGNVVAAAVAENPSLKEPLRTLTRSANPWRHRSISADGSSRN